MLPELIWRQPISERKSDADFRSPDASPFQAGGAAVKSPEAIAVPGVRGPARWWQRIFGSSSQAASFVEVEWRRPDKSTVLVRWTVSDSAQCMAWLRELKS